MRSRAGLSFLLLLFLQWPVQAQDKGWFATSREHLAQVEMLRELFRLPIGTWKEHLAANQRLLTDDFLNQVERRIRWGLENKHFDDASRFATVGDLTLELRGRRPVFQTELRPLHSGTDLPIGRYPTLLKDASLVRFTKEEKKFLRNLLESCLTDWPDALENQQDSLTFQFLESLQQQVRQECALDNWSMAIKFALLGDLASAIIGRESELRVYVVLNAPAGYRPTVPMDADPRVIKHGIDLLQPKQWD